ncbi:MAG: hypothetical protein L0H70_07000 [Xanthomonadales bacterium]|nr:hypothetical protein [Xanthomonadales bacterium]
MIRRRAILLACLLFVAFVPSAWAVVDPPELVPEHPVAGETVSVSMRVGVCDAFVEKQGYPKVTRSGNSIRVLIASVHATSVDWCIYYPIATAVIPVGEFPRGDYTVQVDRTYQDFVGNEVIETLGLIGFAVTAAQPVVVPALGVYGIALLLLGLLVLAAIALHRRRAATMLALPKPLRSP